MAGRPRTKLRRIATTLDELTKIGARLQATSPIPLDGPAPKSELHRQWREAWRAHEHLVDCLGRLAVHYLRKVANPETMQRIELIVEGDRLPSEDESGLRTTRLSSAELPSRACSAPRMVTSPTTYTETERDDE
jgi:hypothetical protein